MNKLNVDSNVPMIATGQIGEAWAVVILEEIAKGRVAACTDTFFAQELLETYWAWGKNYEGKRIFNAFSELIPEMLPVSVEDFDKAQELHQSYPKVTPRDLLHAAVMLRQGVERVFSVDGTHMGAIDNITQPSLGELLQELGLQGEYVDERSR